MDRTPFSRTEKAAIAMSAFAVGLMFTIWVLDRQGFFS